MATRAAYGERPAWTPARPRFRPLIVFVSWLLGAVSLLVAAGIVPHVSISNFWGAVLTAAVIAVLNAVLPPVVAALRLPFMALLGFVLVLFLDAAMLLIASGFDSSAIEVDSFGWALLTALVAAAVSVVFQVIVGINDDETYNLRVIRRIVRRQGGAE